MWRCKKSANNFLRLCRFLPSATYSQVDKANQPSVAASGLPHTLKRYLFSQCIKYKILISPPCMYAKIMLYYSFTAETVNKVVAYHTSFAVKSHFINF